LQIELIAITADVINDRQLRVSKKKINILATLVANAAQEYMAIALELGILRPLSGQPRKAGLTFDKSFVAEQKQLADLGLDDWRDIGLS